VTRILLSLVLSVCAIFQTTGAASARPVQPPCTLSLAFAAFRDTLDSAIGDDLVGECDGAASSDEQGNAWQRTTGGTLCGTIRNNLVSFHDGAPPVQEEAADQEPCFDEPVQHRLGSLHTWIRSQERGKTIHQTMMAFSGHGAAQFLNEP
jgi:hypothetical protein